MNREQRRRYNKKNKTHWTKEQFETFLALERLKSGNYDLSNMDLKDHEFIHVDNAELAPDGTEVKLNFDSLDYRCNHVDKTNEAFRNWVAEAKKEPDKIYHITREGAKQSLVCLEEDKRTVELDGKEVEAPKWLFDLYADFLVFYEGSWVPLGSVDDETCRKYTEVRVQSAKTEEDKK